ncbi:hypothetical protein KGF56_001942 [Candida oxycetoniae]|uniref:FAD/NAD(P)-binding domain-containing protein n=1 Tax=Candida oxycetoniae TaxID=497107 RepID=A0AAI9SZ27_9ASCO|nr:uncharacterized protein KGF56_001942 [Candida oxycetoniae]KAI3405250.2 hypothetical protein KGF56_001942 [Candida oxycetoniae]
MSNSKEVIIIGGSYAAILALKTLFLAGTPNLKITIISPNEKAFFNVAAPRLLVDNDYSDKTLVPLKDTIEKLSRQSSSRNRQVRHVKSRVESLDLDGKQLTISSGQVLDYDYLIVASGSRSSSSLWKLDNLHDYDYIINKIDKTREKIKQAESIAIIGGGSTGVETAGEIGNAYKGEKKRIVLYTGSSGPLSNSLPKHLSDTATNKLKQLGVEVVNNQRVSTNDGKEIIFEDGTQKSEKFDLVIEAQKLTPNTEFMPKSELDENQWVVTDEYFRLINHHNVICLGDVLALGIHSIVDLTYNQKPVFTKVIANEILEQGHIELQAYRAPTKMTMIVPIGKSGGVGVLFGWSLPNFVIWFVKARDFMINKARDYFS